jgi:6-phosphogluconate dehydrogenase (decarboxylating)
MAKPNPEPKRSDGNLIVAVAGTAMIAGVCALFTAYIINDILTTMANSQSMALIIVDGGNKFVSDDGKLGEQLSQATMTLRSCLDVSVSLAVGSMLIGCGLVYRLFKK